MGIAPVYTHHPYETPAMPNIPGTGNLLTLPFDLFASIQNIRGALSCNDRQSLTDATIRTVGMPFNAANSIGQNLEVGMKGGLVSARRFSTFAKVATVFGIVLCVIELIIEGVHIYRQKKFLKKFHAQPSLEQKMRWLSKKYLNVDESKKTAKMTKLMRLLRPFAAEQIARDVPVMLQKYYAPMKFWDTYDGNKWAKRIVKMIDVQSKKRIYFHSLGLATLSISLIGLTLCLCPVPPIVSLVFLVSGVALGIFRYLMHKGFYDNPGWTFTWKKTVPKWVLKVTGCHDSLNDPRTNPALFHFYNPSNSRSSG
ncbi:MAG: hypothetical protein KBC64_02740 [Simkaniaceae bacterium]|nr:hypothetical protein [Simkaniaceae bacterium]